jgi:hypothetical protein
VSRDCSRAETRFRLSVKWTSRCNSKLGGRGSSFRSVVQSAAGRRAVEISLRGLYCSYKPVFCSHVTLTGYPLHSLVSPSLLLPRVTACYTNRAVPGTPSTGVKNMWSHTSTLSYAFMVSTGTVPYPLRCIRAVYWSDSYCCGLVLVLEMDCIVFGAGSEGHAWLVRLVSRQPVSVRFVVDKVVLVMVSLPVLHLHAAPCLYVLTEGQTDEIWKPWNKEVRFQKPRSLESKSIFIRLQRIRAKIIGVTWWGQMYLHYFSDLRVVFFYC